LKALFYKYLIRAAKLFGPGFFILVAKGVATGYFMFSSKRRSISRDFCAVLFPTKSWTYHYYATWKQFLNFTYIFLDRFIKREARSLDYTIEGRKYLVETSSPKKGGILLTAHMDNWEVAAHLLTKFHMNLKLLLYIGIRDNEEIEKIRKQSVRQDGIRVIGVDRKGGSPFDIVEGIRFLQNGGFISMAGDVVR
jgi:lauroyl/myristoyl acyltransferase